MLINYAMKPLVTQMFSEGMRSSRGMSQLTSVVRTINPDLCTAMDIKIPVPWGHIAGKWWGPKDTRPLLGLHGWQDNCGTFDTLAPLLPSHISLLAIDFPGHGYSSRIPQGIMYQHTDSIMLIKLIQNHFKWEKVSLLGHSMGSLATFMYSCVFPEHVDIAIGIDALKPHVAKPERIAENFHKKTLQFLVADERNKDASEPPSYTMDEMVERLHLGTYKSIAKDKCHYLLKRNVAESKVNPNKYYFTRDNRLKANMFPGFSQEVSVELCKHIKCPYMAVKVKQSPFYEKPEYYFEIIELMQKNNENFEFHQVDGTHHVHLNEPEKLSGIINEFILKYRPDVSNSKL